MNNRTLQSETGPDADAKIGIENSVNHDEGCPV